MVLVDFVMIQQNILVCLLILKTSIEICRGHKGVAIVNLGETKKVKIKTDLKDSLYKDLVHRENICVKNHVLTALLKKNHSYIVLLK